MGGYDAQNQRLLFKTDILPIRFMKHDFSKTGEFFYPHWHEEIEVLIVTQGVGCFTIGDTIYHVKAGEMVIIGSNLVHSTYMRNDGNSCFYKFFCNIDAPILGVAPFIRRTMGTARFHNPIDCTSGPGKLISDDIFSLGKELASTQAGHECFVMARLYAIFGVIARYMAGGSEVRDGFEQSRTREFLRPIFEYIDAHYYDDISLEIIAGQAHMSVSHFCNVFKRSTGTTFINYLSLYRTGKAAQMLSGTASITEIAERCGFSSVNTLNRCFRNYYKCSPTQYRMEKK